MQNLCHLIERLEMLEERAGVTLEALFAGFDDYGCLRINGELHPKRGTELGVKVEVVASVYDSSGRLMYTDSEVFEREGFYGFEPFSFLALKNSLPEAPSRIRIYPKARREWE